MNRVLLALCALVVSLAMASDSQARILGRRGCGSGGCGTSSGCNVSSANTGCNISAAAPQQASAAALAQQILDESGSQSPGAVGQSSSSPPVGNRQPATASVVLDRSAAIAFCALPRDPVVLGRVAAK